MYGLERTHKSTQIHKKKNKTVVSGTSGITKVMNQDIFVSPEPVVWNLDEFVLAQSFQEDSDTLPVWITALSEGQASRIFYLSTCGDVNAEKEIQDIFFQSNIPDPLKKNSHFRNHIIRSLQTEESIERRQLQLWVCQQNDRLYTVPGIIVRSPELLRSFEQNKLIKPLLRRITTDHFVNYSVGLKKRTLLDLGAGDGEITNSLQDQFGTIVAIEEHEELFRQLAYNSSRYSNINPQQVDIFDLLKVNGSIPADTVLMSHLLYGMEGDKDIELVNWTIGQVRQDGLVIIVLNDTTEDVGTSADVRKHFQSSRDTPSMRKYADLFEAKNMGIRLIRPELRISASTQSGKIALTDIIRFLIPGNIRKYDESIRRYVSSLPNTEGTLTFTHRLAVLVASSAISSVHEDWAHLDMQSSESAHRSHNKQTSATTGIISSKEHSSVDTLEWPSFHHALPQTSPTDILSFLDRVGECTEYGLNDQALQMILIKSGVSRMAYKSLIQNRVRLEAMQNSNVLTIEEIFDLKSKKKKETPSREKRTEPLRDHMYSEASFIRSNTPADYRHFLSKTDTSAPPDTDTDAGAASTSAGM